MKILCFDITIEKRAKNDSALQFKIAKIADLQAQNASQRDAF